MKRQSALDMYRERMQEIVLRLGYVESLFGRPDKAMYLPTLVESIYLQFRHVLELIATASLSVNQKANEELRLAGRRKWHAGDILDAVEQINPSYFYPEPIRTVEDTLPSNLPEGVDPENYRGEWIDFKGDYLTREKFTTLYGASSRLLHTPNPFDRRAPTRDRKTDTNQLRQAARWHKRIVELLTHHKFRPAGEPDTKLFVCHTVGENAEFHISEWEQVESSMVASVRGL